MAKGPCLGARGEVSRSGGRVGERRPSSVSRPSPHPRKGGQGRPPSTPTRRYAQGVDDPEPTTGDPTTRPVVTGPGLLVSGPTTGVGTDEPRGGDSWVSPSIPRSLPPPSPLYPTSPPLVSPSPTHGLSGSAVPPQ